MPQSASSEPGSASNRRWLVDENVAPAVTAFLRGMGEDVLDVKEEGWFGESDAELFARAQQDGRIILTYDTDFGVLRRLRQRHPGIVLVRLRNLRSHRVIAALDRFLEQYSVKDLKNALAVLEETRVRLHRHARGDRAARKRRRSFS